MKISIKKWLKKIKHEIWKATSSPAIKKILESQICISLIFWLMILVGTGIGLTMHLMYIISLYNEKPINTEVTEYPSNISEFPSVTICRTFNVLSKTAFQKYISLKLDKFEGRTLNDFIRIMYLYVNTLFFPIQKEKYLLLLESVRRSEWRRIFYAIPSNLTILIPDILVFCEINGIKCDFNHFRRHDHPSYYNCYTFDLDSFLKNNSVAFSSNEINLSLILNTYTGVGSRDQGTVTMATDSIFQLEIHPPGTRPALTENVIFETSERLIQIEVKKLENNKMYLDRRPCFQNLVGKIYGYELVEPMTNFSNLNFYQTAFKEKYPKFTRNDCINDEWQKLFVKICNCFSPLLPLSRYVVDQVKPAENSISWCTNSNMMTEYMKVYDYYYNYTKEGFVMTHFFYYITKDGQVFNMANELNGTKSAQAVECLVANANLKENLEIVNKLCPFFCFQENYETEAKILKWETTTENSNGIKLFINKEAQLIKSNLNKSELWSNHTLTSAFTSYTSLVLSYINIIYHSSTKSIITEHETYPLINLCSDIGGILGLWIGVSILVIAELIVIMKTIFTACLEKEREEEDKEFIPEVACSRSEIISSFMSSTSFHGIGHLVATKDIYHRVFWIFILIFCSVGLSANVEKVVSLFLSKPISIELQYNLDLEEYPSITFCPSTISAFGVRNSTYLVKVNRVLVDFAIPFWIYLYQQQREKFNNSPSGQEFLDFESQLLREASIKHTLMRYLLTYNLSSVSRKDSYNFIFSCEFSNQRCSFNNFSLRYHPNHKICFTFQSSEENKRLGFPEYLSLLILSNDIDKTLLFNTTSVSLFRGGVYEVHPYLSMPIMKFAHPFTQATRQIITLKKSVDKIMNSDFYRCQEDEDRLITLLEEDIGFDGISREFQYRYSSELCEQLKVQSAVYKSCNCISSTLPLSKEQNSMFGDPRKCADVPIELFNESIKIKRENNTFNVYISGKNNSTPLENFLKSFEWGQTFLKEFDCHSRVMLDDNVKQNATSECFPLCNRITYTLKINENETPFFYESHVMINIFNEYFGYLNAINKTESSVITSSVSKYIDTDAVFNILTGFHFAFQTVETKLISQNEGYTLVGVLSDLGGVLGLWFGISVATLFELIELIILLIFL